MAFGIGLMASLAVCFMAESVVADLTASGIRLSGFPIWRMHRATACLGVSVFIVSFYSLETLGRKSKRTAWRATAPWVPLIALTAVATIVPVPVYALIVFALANGVWAFRRMNTVR